MKFIISCFLFIHASLLIAQSTTGDTTAYTIGRYDVKKPMKVSALAEKLNVEVDILVKLNKFRNANSVLVKDQHIKIPVYPKQSKNREKGSTESIQVAQPATADKGQYKASFTSKTSDFERDKVRLIMIDAVIELNEAIMEGVKVSLDSLDDRNDGADSRKTQLQRDREVWMPYILHVQDSLTKEIAQLKQEKKEIENRIDPPVITADTVVSDNDVVIYQVTTYSDNRISERVVTKVVTRVSNKNKDGVKKMDTKGTKTVESQLLDTIIVYDMPSAPKSVPVTIDSFTTPTYSNAIPWETAKALKPIPNVSRDTTVAIKIGMPNSTDTLVIKPIVKQMQASQPAVTRGSQQKVAYTHSADSIKRIKAEFLLRRAQKAMKEKNFDGALEQLHKSIELYPKYFDAWFAIAETHELAGAHQQALKDYEICRAMDSTQPILFFNMGNVYSKMKQKTEAMHYYNLAVALAPDHIPSLMARASILADWKSYKASITDYNQVLKIDRQFHYAYKARGQVKLLTKEFASAMDDFTRFLIFEQTDPSAYYYRGLAKIGNNELLEGCIDLSTAAGMGYSAAERAIKKSCE